MLVPAFIDPFRSLPDRPEPALDRFVRFAAVLALVLMAALFVFWTVWAVLLLT